MTTRLDLFLSHLVNHNAANVTLAAGQAFSMSKDGVDVPLVEASGDQLINEHVLALLSEVADPMTTKLMNEGKDVAFTYASQLGNFSVMFVMNKNGKATATITPSATLKLGTAPAAARKTQPPVDAVAAAAAEESVFSMASGSGDISGVRPAARGGSDDTSGVRPAARGGSDDTSGVRPAAHGGSDDTSGVRPAAHGGSDDTSGIRPATRGGSVERMDRVKVPPTAKPLPSNTLAPRTGVNPVVPGSRLDEILAEMTARKGENLILDAGTSIFFISHGRPKTLAGDRGQPLTNQDVQALLMPIASERSKEKIRDGQATSFDYTAAAGDMLVEFRVEGPRYVARLTPLRLAREKNIANTPIPNLLANVEPVGDRPALERWFDLLIEMGGSDLHLSGGLCPVVRLHGEMLPVYQLGVPSVEQLEQLVRAVIPPRNLEEFDATNDTDFAYAMPKARLRANIFRDRHGIGAVFRVIPSRVPSAADLNLPQSIIDLCKYNKGLILVTGPTGSGKSTTLAAMVDWINENRSGHLLTLEDPIEFTHEQKRCLVRQRQVGVHTGSFSRALRAALREDPDFVLLGELRDLETTAMAIETAETGHLVLATLHTNTAASAIDRVIDQFPADREAQIRLMLSESLRGVVAQTLCRKKSGGRVAALEILRVTQGIQTMIREKKTFQIESMMQVGKTHGMQTLNDALLNLAKAGTITPEEAYVRAIDKAGIKGQLEPLGFKDEVPVGP